MNIEQCDSDRAPDALPSRRAFLEGIGTVAFLLAFQLPNTGARAQELPARPGPFNAFLAIGEDDVVTAIIAQTEGGQGIPPG